MHIYNSKTKQKEKFIPLEEKEVKVYVCGPTVYDDAHLGHARSSIAFDLLHRVLKANGYSVTFVKNYTDIDDKILNKMKESGQSLKQITTYYIDRYQSDMTKLNIIPPTLTPKATGAIEDIINFVNHLLEKNIAYKIDDGIYFDTSYDKEYLNLSNMHIDDAKARVQTNTQKKRLKRLCSLEVFKR